MLEAAERVEIADVEVLDDGDLVLRCRVGDKDRVRCRRCGSSQVPRIKHRGDRGRLVLPHDLAVDLGLVG